MTPLDEGHTEEVRYVLDETRPAEPGAANGEPRTPGSNEPNTCLVGGPLSPARRLTADFGGFVERLEAVPGLDHDRLARYLAGVDLIHGLAGPPDAGVPARPSLPCPRRATRATVTRRSPAGATGGRQRARSTS